MICNKCGTYSAPGQNYCKKCGEPLQDNTPWICQECETRNTGSTCVVCGAPKPADRVYIPPTPTPTPTPGPAPRPVPGPAPGPAPVPPSKPKFIVPLVIILTFALVVSTVTAGVFISKYLNSEYSYEEPEETERTEETDEPEETEKPIRTDKPVKTEKPYETYAPSPSPENITYRRGSIQGHSYASYFAKIVLSVPSTWNVVSQSTLQSESDDIFYRDFRASSDYSTLYVDIEHVPDGNGDVKYYIGLMKTLLNNTYPNNGLEMTSLQEKNPTIIAGKKYAVLEAKLEDKNYTYSYIFYMRYEGDYVIRLATFTTDKIAGEQPADILKMISSY